MTLFLDFRTQDVGGAVGGPNLYEGDGTAAPLALTLIPQSRIAARLAGKNLLFATHGFNVSRTYGAASLGTLDAHMALASPGLFIGMLWPGDCWLPLVDYPFEGDVAIDCGKRLAAFCNAQCAHALGLSFASHSLGARLVLEAANHMTAHIRSLCLTAGAINNGCLIAEYAGAVAATDRIDVLASNNDDVLKLAFAIGDPFADILHDDHSPFQAALGAHGPRTPVPRPQVAYPWQIPDASDYGHGNYLPPGAPPAPPADTRWHQVADFMKRTFLRQPQPWPPG